MPWMEKDVDQQRVKFVVRATSGQEQMAALCREFGVSRPTGYVWRKRFQQAGSVAGVVERSRRPEHCPEQTAAPLQEQLVELRRRDGWGPQEVQVVLSEPRAPVTA